MGGSSGPASAGGDYMEQHAGMDMGGSSGSASETNRRKLLSLLRLAATSAAHFSGAFLVSSGCLRSATRVLPLAFLRSGASAETHIFFEAFVLSA